MLYDNRDLSELLGTLDLGSSVAEHDNLLEGARVETSAFTDILNDRVDLVPGTKGSGKSALYRIFVDFLPDYLLQARKVVIAHGVQRTGDEVFHAFEKRFKKMDEQDFVNFWCIYFVSLAHEHFVKSERYDTYLRGGEQEIKAFRNACQAASIPEFRKQRNLKEVLDWAIEVTRVWKPKLSYRPPGDIGQFEVDLFGKVGESAETIRRGKNELPVYAADVRKKLEGILEKVDLSLWLMVDRLDEIFPRRSELETRALRGLLRTLRVFESPEIRIKVFLRDDILEQVIANGKGFTALTHVTARQADTLRWSEEQILAMIVNRCFSARNSDMIRYFEVDTERLGASHQYRQEDFYSIFPPTVHRGEKQSRTLRWIYTHTQDGRGVVTPRDVLELLTRAKQHQQDLFTANPSGQSQYLVNAPAIRYGLIQLSRRKTETYLHAEFPQLWPYIERFRGGKTEYTERALRRLLGSGHREITLDLVSIGLMGVERRKGKAVAYKFPFIYREGLELTQGRASS